MGIPFSHNHGVRLYTDTDNELVLAVDKMGNGILKPNFREDWPIWNVGQAHEMVKIKVGGGFWIKMSQLDLEAFVCKLHKTIKVTAPDAEGTLSMLRDELSLRFKDQSAEKHAAFLQTLSGKLGWIVNVTYETGEYEYTRTYRRSELTTTEKWQYPNAIVENDALGRTVLTNKSGAQLVMVDAPLAPAVDADGWVECVGGADMYEHLATQSDWTGTVRMNVRTGKIDTRKARCTDMQGKKVHERHAFKFFLKHFDHETALHLEGDYIWEGVSLKDKDWADISTDALHQLRRSSFETTSHKLASAARRWEEQYQRSFDLFSKHGAYDIYAIPQEGLEHGIFEVGAYTWMRADNHEAEKASLYCNKQYGTNYCTARGHYGTHDKFVGYDQNGKPIGIIVLQRDPHGNLCVITDVGYGKYNGLYEVLKQASGFMKHFARRDAANHLEKQHLDCAQAWFHPELKSATRHKEACLVELEEMGYDVHQEEHQM